MSVQGDGERRWFELEIEVAGTPEEVWRAIATGEGISAWFGDTTSDEAEDGDFKSGMWPGMESVSKITNWNPPHSYSMKSPPAAPGLPEFAAEWTVEAKSGGKCIVRIVQSLFASGADWDDQLENMESGWPQILAVLRLYLEHYRGRKGASVRLLSPVSGTEREAWDVLAQACGFAGKRGGERFARNDADAPALAGVVEDLGEGEQRTALLRLDEPADGIAWAGAFTFNGAVMLGLRMFLYGDDPAALAQHASAGWQTWLARRFGGES